MDDCNRTHSVGSLCEDQPRVLNEDTLQMEGKQEPRPGRFKQVCRTVLLMLKVCRGMVNYAQSGILDYDSIKLNIRSNEEGLAFDKDRFRRRKEFRWPAVYLDIVNKPSSNRSQGDIRALQKMMHCLRSFRKFDFEAQREICRYIKYERYTRNRVIIREGHEPQGVYFMFSGTVAETFSDGKGHTNPEVRLYHRGDVFGNADIALEQPRSTTLVCDGFTEVLFLDLNDIKHTGLIVALEKETLNVRDLLSQKSDISSLPYVSIDRLVSTCYLMNIDDQKVIDVWSRKPKWVYVVYKGTCDVVKKCSTDDLPKKLKENLRKLLAKSETGSGTGSFKTLNHYEEDELTDRQKILRFIDSVDNNITSRVNSSWSPKRPESYHRGDSPDSAVWEKVTCGPRDSPNTDCSQSSERKFLDEDLTPESLSSTRTSFPVTRTTLPHYFSFTLRHLEPGTVFGSSFLSKENRDIFFLSKGCTVIAIPTSVFLLTSSDDITLEIRKSHSSVPNGQDLCSKYAKDLVWKYFKNNFIESLRSESFEDAWTPNGRRNVKPYYTRNLTVSSKSNEEQGYCRMAYTPEYRRVFSQNDATTRRKSCTETRPQTVIPLSHSSTLRHIHRADHVIKSAPPCHRMKPVTSSAVRLRRTRFTASTATCQMRQSLTGVRHVLQLLPDKI